MSYSNKNPNLFLLFIFKISLLFAIAGIILPLPLFAVPQTDNEKAAYYLKKATQHYNKKEYKKAESAFRLLLKTRIPLHPDFYFFYGKVQALNGKYDKAEGNISTYMDNAGPTGQYYQQAKIEHTKVRKEIAKKAKAKQAEQSNSFFFSNSSTKKKSSPQKLSKLPQMVIITPRSYMMGSNHGSDDQRPIHKVTLSKAFAVSQHEITFKQYLSFAKATKTEIPDDAGFGKKNHPVINVSLYDALAYCRWLSQKLGRNFRLPTEAEWEYFARTSYKSKLGFKDLIGLGDANCEECRYIWEDDATKAVGNYPANSFELYDVFGNVWEWTCSAYTQKYNGAEKKCLQTGDIEGKTIAVRGASWKSSKHILKAYIRYNNFPTYRSNDLGFRIVEDL